MSDRQDDSCPCAGGCIWYRCLLALTVVAGVVSTSLSSFSCRNPLHALTDSANYIMESCKPDDAIQEDVSIILSGAMQMSRLLVSIMDWTKVSMGQLGMDITNVDVAQLVLEWV